MMRAWIGILSMVVLLVTASMATAAPRVTVTTGAVKLNPAQLKRIAPATCGKPARVWLAGTAPRGRFLAHQQRAANLSRMARAARGAAKQRLLKQAAAARRLHAQQQKLCSLPDSARQLPARSLTTIKVAGRSIACGKLGGWLPGTLTRGYFTAYTKLGTRAKLESRYVKGAARTRLLRASTSFAKLARQHSRACVKAGQDAGSTTPKPTTPTPPAATTPLRFNLAGARGLGVRSTSSSLARSRKRARAAKVTAQAIPAPASNLEVITADGTLRDAATSGTASISRTLISPTGETFLLFQNRVNLADTSAMIATDGCLLARVGADGTPTCVDSSLQAINWTVGMYGIHPGVQFDAGGAVYYSGWTPAGTVLRRSAGGTITDLLPAANVMLGGFYVAPDGNVFVIGMTNTTSDRWFRRYNATGGLATLLGGEVEWVFGFPDGNVYAASIITNQGVHRYLASTAMMDPTVWIGDATATHDATDCGWSECYRIKTPAVRTSTDAVYAVNYKKRLVKLYPALEVPASQVATATLVTAAGAKLAVAGQNASGQYVLYLHDAATGAEQQLIGPASEIELYHLAYSASRDVLVFDGLRFADNKVVLGEVDLASGEVRVTNQLGTKWADLQLFG